MQEKKLKNLKTGEVFEIVPMSEPLSKGYALGMGKVDGITVKEADGNYAFLPAKLINNGLWKLVD